LAQSWQPIGSDSFVSIAGLSDGSLTLIRYPGDILRSTDGGLTWHEVYHGLRPLARIAETARHEAVVVGFGSLLLSIDSGRAWTVVDSADDPAAILALTKELPKYDPKRVTALGATLLLDDSSNVLLSRDGGVSWRRVLRMPGVSGGDAQPTIARPTRKLLSIAVVDSVCYAVGEPGLMYVSDSRFAHWRELHTAPFQFDTSILASHGIVSFANAARGAIALSNRIYLTEDSGTTWRETVLPDTGAASPIRRGGLGGPDNGTRVALSFLWTSDTSAVVGMSSGDMFSSFDAGKTFGLCAAAGSSTAGGPDNGTRLPLQLGDSLPTQRAHDWSARPVIQIGWQDQSRDGLFVLTDSTAFTTDIRVEHSSSFALPLAPGEHAQSLCFPDKYTVYLLARDTITINDTLRDTSCVYRSLDGGGIWMKSLRTIAGGTRMFFVSPRRGYVCGANGAILMTDDTGATWGRTISMTRQQLRNIRFVNDSTGYCVGDSGVVLITRNNGRWWRPTTPVPLFTHPRTSYTSIAFAGPRTVYVLGDGQCFRETIPDPMRNWRISRRREIKKVLAVSVTPNPSRGSIQIQVTVPSNADRTVVPSLSLCDPEGRIILDNILCSSIGNGVWRGEADCSSLSMGPYLILATCGDWSGKCNLAIEH
jgi:photosystem II stability/assembly factor-like uncharacterized protein